MVLGLGCVKKPALCWVCSGALSKSPISYPSAMKRCADLESARRCSLEELALTEAKEKSATKTGRERLVYI